MESRRVLRKTIEVGPSAHGSVALFAWANDHRLTEFAFVIETGGAPLGSEPGCH